VIFATCGSSGYPFARMMEALAGLAPDDLQVQHGPNRPPPCEAAFPYLPFDEVVAKIQAADVVISHAGVGTILCAIRAGHTPVVFPRLRRYGEAVDDHQAELATALAEHGTVVLATAEDLAQAVASVPPRRDARLTVSRPLIEAVHAALEGGAPVTAGVRA
jgi:UDP-N-acetylglucosamine transferase subunit ALG13